MRLLKTASLAAVIALELSGVSYAGPRGSHLMLIEWPDGTVAQIHYSGDTPPTVMVPTAIDARPLNVRPVDARPTMESGLVAADPFVVMRQVAQQMDREVDALMRSVDAMAAMQGVEQPMTVGAPSGLCMQSVQVTYTGQGQPHVISQTSGNCGPIAAPAHPAAQPDIPALTGSPHGPAPRVTEARNTVHAPVLASGGGSAGGPLRLADNTVR